MTETNETQRFKLRRLWHPKVLPWIAIVISTFALGISIFTHYAPYSEAAKRLQFDELKVGTSVEFKLESCRQIRPVCESVIQDAMEEVEKFEARVELERIRLSPRSYMDFQLTIARLRRSIAVQSFMSRIQELGEAKSD